MLTFFAGSENDDIGQDVVLFQFLCNLQQYCVTMLTFLAGSKSDDAGQEVVLFQFLCN